MSEEKLKIIDDIGHVESFMTDCRIAFDAAFIPDAVEWSEVRAALEDYLAEGRAAEYEGASEDDFAYIRSRLGEYWKEFGGCEFQGQRCLVCNMHMYGDEEEEFEDPLRGSRDDSPDFTYIMDGGRGVVRFTYRLSDRTIAALEWNGEA